VQQFCERHRHTLETLAGYDAAIAAGFIRQPMHLALALFDPVVPPPGQFAIHNALRGERQRFVMAAGHYDHPEREADERRLLAELADFFAPLAMCNTQTPAEHEPRIPPLVQPAPASGHGTADLRP
jgi:cephalosporin-C deacetylase